MKIERLTILFLTSIVAVSHLHLPQTHCPRPEQISDDPGLKETKPKLNEYFFLFFLLFALLNF